MCFQPATDCEWLLLLYLQDCLINLINQSVFAQHSGDAKPCGCCCLLPSPLFPTSAGRSQARRELQKGSLGWSSHVSYSSKVSIRGQKQILLKSDQNTAPGVSPASTGQDGQRDQGPLPDSMAEPEERSLLPGPAATVGSRSLTVPGGAGRVPGCPGGSKGRGPGGDWQEPVAAAR